MTSLAIFDLDHTLVSANISFAFGRFLHKMGKLKFRQALYCCGAYFRYKFVQPSLPRLHSKVLGSFLKEMPLSRLREEVEHFLDHHLERLIYRPAMARLKQAKEVGAHLMILSGSPDFLVGPVARRLGIDRWDATRYDVDGGNRLHNIGHVMEGELKATRALESAQALEIGTGSIAAYTDSIVDLPLLEVAGKAVGVRPCSRLMKMCRKRGWEII